MFSLPIENNRGRIGGRWWAAVVLRGALPAAHRGGAGEMSALSLSRPTEDCAPLISYGSTVAPEEVPTINLPWWFYRWVLVGISGSGPPPLYAHYNLLLPTVPHENPSARPLRFSIAYCRIIFSYEFIVTWYMWCVCYFLLSHHCFIKIRKTVILSYLFEMI